MGSGPPRRSLPFGSWHVATPAVVCISARPLRRLKSCSALKAAAAGLDGQRPCARVRVAEWNERPAIGWRTVYSPEYPSCHAAAALGPWWLWYARPFARSITVDENNSRPSDRSNHAGCAIKTRLDSG